MHRNKIVAIFITVLFTAGVLVFAGGPKRRAPIDINNPPKPYADGEVLVKFKKGIGLNAVNQFAEGMSLELKKQFSQMSKLRGQQVVLLKSLESADALALAKAISADPNVEYAHPNYRRDLCATPNDPQFNLLWGMHNTGQTGGTSDADIDAPEAWNVSTGSQDVIVAVVDTGFDYKHPDLAANAWRNAAEYAGVAGVDDDGNGYIDDIYGIDPAGVDGSGTSGDADPMDGYGHGTHCAGSIGAVGNNSLGVAGVNWNVKIMGLKFFDDAGGNAYDAFAIECIEYAVWEKLYYGQNVVAINASWGGFAASESFDALRDAIEMATDAGIVFCAASGNGDGDADAAGDNNDSEIHHYPSDYTLPGIIAVTATDHNDALGSFANYGATSVDLGAPGVSIRSTVPGRYIPVASDIFFDNMENGLGKWTTGGTPNSWGISTDQETLDSVNFPVPSPTHFLSDSPGADYANNSNSWVMNNTDIDLTGCVGQATYIGFAAAWGMNTNDHGMVEISSNGGTSWTTIHDQAYDGYVYYWSRYSGLIPDSFKTAHFRIRFRLTSNASSVYDGFLIDDVGIGTSLTYSYESWDGTSMATPHVAGAVGLMASVFPSESVAQRKKRILDNGDAKASLAGRTVSGRRLNLYNSITASSPTPDPALRVTSPNGGESWVRNTVHPITWTYDGTVGNVNLDYSTNNGTSWTSIATNINVALGTYSWTTPNVNNTQNNCRVRVREADGSPSDQSDAVFSIVRTSTETISTPDTPKGSATAVRGVSYPYSTGGSVSNMGHPVQYYFDWGDGTNSGWLASGTTSALHSWSVSGTFNVRVQARCASHTARVSSWSVTFPVIIFNSPTWAAVTRFGACGDGGQPAVEWWTGTESGTVGYNLWRKDRETGRYEQVNATLLPALANAPQGGAYRLADPGALNFEPVTYRLEEIDAQGRSLMHGPFTVVFGGASGQDRLDREPRLEREEPSDITGYQRFARARSLYEEARLRARHQELARATLQAASAKERARVTVKGRGLFYVTSGQVASTLGVSDSLAASLIGGHNLKLTTLGKECAWLADANGAGLFFYNEGKETQYSDKNVYLIERGSGLAMEAVSGGNAGPAPDGQSYAETLRFSAGKYFLPSQDEDKLADDWMWEVVAAGGAGKTFALDVPGATGTGQATLRVILRGATDTEAANDHHAVVKVNGTEVGSGYWDGGKDYALELTFSASQLADGANTVEVSGALDMGAPYSIFYVDSMELSYARRYRAENNALICRPSGNAVITVSGLTELQAVVLDVTVPRRPFFLTGVAPDVAGRVTWVPRSAEREYLVSGLNAAQRPLSVVGDRPSQLKGRARPAEYIVIAPEEFAAAAQELADYRKGKGLKALVVTLEDIYDAFSFGVTDPNAIRTFLAYANKNWGKVRYAVLAGKGTYDYNDYLGNGDNLVPALLAPSAYGYYAADRAYGDITGKNLVPEIAVGRLPAVTNAELRSLIAKVKAYESGQGDWTGKALFIADDADDGGDFAQGCNDLAGIMSGYASEKIVLAGSVSETRSQIMNAWNAGAALVTYCGHGGISQLAHEDIFDADDAAALANGGQLPLATLLTCVAGRFEVPGYTSLAEALALNGSGGMAGGLAPSGAALHGDSLKLAEEFYKAAYRGRAASVGEALVEAMKRYVQQGGKAQLLNAYNWIGDPALAVK